jgi:hypothetical protein
MRRGVALVVFAIALIAGWLGYSKYTQAQRQASYRTALAPYKRDLTVGMDREQVIAYLRAHDLICHTVRYGGSDGDTCEIKIAEEPVGLLNGLICEPWTVYAAFEFTSADKLREIHIRKIGTCL